ncbi:sporulation-specific protein 15 isoform X2 [Nilaparvata lugens]|uniref:sporulation-specific protein 15 isoform X1 n=1 Tax=Nilaparvata lugens TaxID=108931 RepID=UPI00193CC3EE|nr:sporulation-specific protein 15 isoform X1 [Nilaparvata lugens]XP_039277500.1 sporulation-specific protein 15 isoform X1 [Nilaparvata lugens]XP_039277501.1 sporulation-specific protein 15 isoform X2 [Nilaparvata lugens]
MMELPYEYRSETNAGTEDEFSSTLKKIIDRQSNLERIKLDLKKENDLLTNDLSSKKQQKEDLLKVRETLKLSVVREQDNFDQINARLMNEMLTIKTLFANVDTASNLTDNFIKKNSIVSSFFNGISCGYYNLQETINNLASKITKENMCIKDKVTNSKQCKEKFQTELQNDIIQCEYDLENVNKAVSCLKNVTFEKYMELSKLTVTTEFVCAEESKNVLNLQNLEADLKKRSQNGEIAVNDKKSFICNLEKREETLRNILSECETEKEVVNQSICVSQHNLNDLEKSYRERELEEKASKEKLQLSIDTMNELLKVKSSLQNDLESKENVKQDNEKLISALLELENKYKELISEKEDIESDIEFLENDMKVYLLDIESEKRTQSEGIATRQKLQTDIDSLNAQLINSNKKHNENMSIMRQEIEKTKNILNESEIFLLQTQTSNASKTQTFHEYKSSVCGNDSCIEMLELETKKLQDFSSTVEENRMKFTESLQEIETALNSKKEELIAAEKNAERISLLKQEIEKAKLEIEQQKEHHQHELLQLESYNSSCKNDAEEQFKTLKLHLDNKINRINTELLEFQTGVADLGTKENKRKISIEVINKELVAIKNKTIDLHNTKMLLQSKVSNARKNLRSADDKSDDVSGSQLSIIMPKKDDDESSSSGISTTDPRWSSQKRKSSGSIGEGPSQKIRD